MSSRWPKDKKRVCRKCRHSMVRTKVFRIADEIREEFHCPSCKKKEFYINFEFQDREYCLIDPVEEPEEEKIDEEKTL